MEACACSLCFHTWMYIGTHIKLPLALPLACPASIRSVSALGAGPPLRAGRCRQPAPAGCSSCGRAAIPINSVPLLLSHALPMPDLLGLLGALVGTTST